MKFFFGLKASPKKKKNQETLLLQILKFKRIKRKGINKRKRRKEERMIMTIHEIYEKEQTEIRTYYHKAIGKHLDTIVTKRDSSKLKVSKVTTKDLSRHGNNIIEQVNYHSWSCKVEKQFQFNPGS
jgi:hypothetical protein